MLLLICGFLSGGVEMPEPSDPRRAVGDLLLMGGQQRSTIEQVERADIRTIIHLGKRAETQAHQRMFNARVRRGGGGGGGGGAWGRLYGGVGGGEGEGGGDRIRRSRGTSRRVREVWGGHEQQQQQQQEEEPYSHLVDDSLQQICRLSISAVAKPITITLQTHSTHSHRCSPPDLDALHRRQSLPQDEPAGPRRFCVQSEMSCGRLKYSGGHKISGSPPSSPGHSLREHVQAARLREAASAKGSEWGCDYSLLLLLSFLRCVMSFVILRLEA